MFDSEPIWFQCIEQIWASARPLPDHPLFSRNLYHDDGEGDGGDCDDGDGLK